MCRYLLVVGAGENRAQSDWQQLVCNKQKQSCDVGWQALILEVLGI